MKKIINNSNLVISMFLIFSFIIDILTNLTIDFKVSFGAIIRGLLLLYILLVILLKYKNKSNYFIIGLLGIFSVIYILVMKNFTSIENIVKYDNFIIMFLYMYNMYKYDNNKISDTLLSFVLFLYSSVIILAFITNTSLNSFAVTRIGYVGWFNSANEVSAIICAIVPFIFVKLLKEQNRLNIISLVFGLIATLIIGTRLPIIVYGISFIYYLFIKFKNKNKINFTNIAIFLTFLFVLIYKFQDIPFFVNFKEHLSFLNIKNPLKIFTSYHLIDHFIFNRRLTFSKVLLKKMFKSPLKNQLFGLSTITKTAEMDIVDILSTFGIIGLIIFIFSLIYIIKKINKKDNINYLPILIIIMTSMLSGHVILSSNVALIVIVVITNSIYKSNKKNVLISSYSLCTGGIETSLVNYIKNINEPNTMITLYLEEKEGYLLKEIPDNVTIKKQKVFNSKYKLISKSLNLINKIKFIIFNYKEYDFSCCYATYSLSSNFLARYASNNSCIYVHSDYIELFEHDINKIKGFFDIRKFDKFRNIVFVSNESKDNFLALYPRFIDKSYVINNFFDEEKIIKLSNEKIKESKPRGKKLFLFVGRIDESSKCFTRMINSFKKVVDQNKKVELWIVGSGPDEKRLKDLIKENKLEDYVKLLGNKKNPYPYFKLCDYFLLTSNYEGFPTVYGEAIILKKKIITTINVSDDVISIPNNFGYICKKDENDISNTILRILENDNLKYQDINIKEANNRKLKMVHALMLK